MLNLVLALLPVVALLAVLWAMDSFKLVGRGAVASALAWGAVAAAISWGLTGTIDVHQTSFVSRYVAPLTEETLKAALIVVYLWMGRVGFLVEATVLGFAVGAGFAVVENVAYLGGLSNAPTVLWVVRGFGTGVLHGATTAIFAMLSRTLMDRRQSHRVLALFPGWAAAVVIHSLYNHLLLPAVAEMCLLLLGLPLLVLWIFQRSEAATREWIGAGMDLDVELLQLVVSDHFEATRFGGYLRQLRARFPGHVVADMFCLLRVELELSVQAKALLMAQQAGLELPADEDLDASLAERQYLRDSIGRTGLLALKPIQVTSHMDAWHRHVLARQKRGL